MVIPGLTTIASKYGPIDTGDRVVAAATKLGMTVSARVDHAAAAASVGMTLRPTEVVIFGNPKSGTPLMQAAQTLGIDLPLKILVWQDGEGKTRLSYNDPHWLADRHGVAAGNRATVDTMTRALASIAQKAAGGTI
jgi:uncharacterized protein (DUF302 family)